MKAQRILLIPYQLTILLFLLVACSPYPQEVQEALNLSGSNKTELEKVLEYYRNNDSLKYKAACFLISNMPYHESRTEISLPCGYDDYFASSDSLFNLYFGGMTAEQIRMYSFKIPDSIRNYLSLRYNVLTDPIYSKGKKDIETVTADYLIDNIETSFKQWKESPLLSNMSFDDFKESVLPYRTTNEPLLYKKSELYKRFYSILNKEGMTRINTSIERYKMYILKMQRISYYTEKKNSMELYDLFLPSTEFNCNSQVTWTNNLFRACGIPVCFEFTPQWPDRENRHFWSASPDSLGIYIPYSTPGNNLKEDWNDHLKYAGKVYRRTFGINKQAPYFLKSRVETIPEWFSVPTLQDETFRYHQTISLELPFSIRTDNRLAYLSFVSKSGIVPVAWGKIDKKSKKALFNQVPLDMTFVLSYYEGDSLKSIGEPFRLIPQKNLTYIPYPLTVQNETSTLLLTWDDKCLTQTSNKTPVTDIYYHEYRYDTTRQSDMILYRKYPLKQHLLKLYQQLKGAYFLAGNDQTGKSDTIAVLSQVPIPEWQTIPTKGKKKYGYLSLHTPNRRPLNIAEIEFWGTLSHSSEPQKLSVKVSDANWNVFDEDVETYIVTPTLDIEFSHPARIKEIRFIPRNANNGIIEGDMYSLCLFKNGSWKELERKKANSIFLIFKKVPTGGIYILKNLDNGLEELPFTYQEGKQIWVSQKTE